MRRRWILVVLGVLVVAGVSLFALNARRSSAPAPQAQPQRLEFLSSDLYVVRRDPLERTLPLTGTLTPLVDADVKAKAAGQLLEVAAREGEHVEKGQVLARIDPTELRAHVAARTADVEAARSQLGLAAKTLEQQRALAAKGFLSKNALQNAESSHEVAQARLGTARAELAVAQEALSNTELRSPLSGTVAARLAEPGERVALDATVLRLVDLSRLTLGAAVPAENIAEVRVGQSVIFRVQGFGERSFTGHIERINPTTTEGTRSIMVHAVVENRDGMLRGGLFANGDLVLERIEDALPVPATAVRAEGDRAYVYKIVEETLRREPVELGVASRNGFVDVRAGLLPGDVIVRNNLGQLREGAQVRVGQMTAQAYR